MREKINIGCGADILDGYINLDYKNQKGVDVICDINNTPWSFKDNTFSESFCSHTLEHVEDLQSTMKEMWRISKPSAKIIIRVPHFSYVLCLYNIHHKRSVGL